MKPKKHTRADTSKKNKYIEEPKWKNKKSEKKTREE